jgi:PIN domain nuclease of toxin-antitoxin system
LLDSHVALWALGDPDRLGPAARAAIVDPGHEVLVSAASLWEISIKQALGKLRLPAAARDWLPGELERSGFDTLSVTAAHALSAGALPPHHRDPFDRMLIAQAIEESLTLVTSDGRLAVYGVSLLRA